MIVLASGDEGVVLQYIDQIDHIIVLTNMCVSFILFFMYSKVTFIIYIFGYNFLISFICT